MVPGRPFKAGRFFARGHAGDMILLHNKTSYVALQLDYSTIIP